jgi:hypothetical protein
MRVPETPGTFVDAIGVIPSQAQLSVRLVAKLADHTGREQGIQALPLLAGLPFALVLAELAFVARVTFARKTFVASSPPFPFRDLGRGRWRRSPQS